MRDILILTHLQGREDQREALFQFPDAGHFDSYSAFSTALDHHLLHYITAFSPACTRLANLRDRGRKNRQNWHRGVGWYLHESLRNALKLTVPYRVLICERYRLACEFFHSRNRLPAAPTLRTMRIEDHCVCHPDLNYIRRCMSFSRC